VIGGWLSSWLGCRGSCLDRGRRGSLIDLGRSQWMTCRAQKHGYPRSKTHEDASSHRRYFPLNLQGLGQKLYQFGHAVVRDLIDVTFTRSSVPERVRKPLAATFWPVHPGGAP
jgi:hypothetical protein